MNSISILRLELQAVGEDPGLSVLAHSPDIPVPEFEILPVLAVRALRVFEAHINSTEQYIAMDLENPSTSSLPEKKIGAILELRSLLGETPEEWQRYLGVQTFVIRQLRQKEYIGPSGCNTAFMEALLDGKTVKQAQVYAQQLRDTIKTRFPWPGTYHKAYMPIERAQNGQ